MIGSFMVGQCGTSPMIGSFMVEQCGALTNDRLMIVFWSIEASITLADHVFDSEAFYDIFNALFEVDFLG